MTYKDSLPSDELKLWQNLYNQSLTIDGKESSIQTDGTKQLILLPMMTYTIISTMLQKLKYLPSSCFNRIVIGKTPICGLRPLSSTSPSLMYKITEILRLLVDGVRKQHITGITMVFYKQNDINTVYDSYSLVFDYSVKLSNNETTSIQMIAHIIHQIDFMFEWNDPLPNDVELTFILSALDQFDNNENKVPSPFHFVKENLKKVYMEHETNELMGRLPTPDGNMWLKILPSTRPLSGSSIHSDELHTKANQLGNKQKTIQSKSNIRSESPVEIVQSTPDKSSKSKKNNKTVTNLIDVGKSGPNLPSLVSSESTKNKKKTGFLSTVKSFITPSRTPAPVKSSTPNIPDLVLIRHTSTPKPGETASRITIGGNDDAQPLSAIYETSISANISSPTPSTITTTDISTATTPMIAAERRNPTRAATVRGQTTATRKKIEIMQIQDDDDDNDDGDDDDDYDEQFKKLFSRRKTKKTTNKSIDSISKPDELSQVSTISSATSNNESIFTPPSTRKRPTADRIGDDLAAEHSTPPKTPRTSRRNRGEDQISIQSTMMDTSDTNVNIDSPRLLRSVTRKLQQQASTQKRSAHETEKTSNVVKDQEAMDCAYVNLERSSIGLHYSMEESD